tara:strand:- start:918 stop:2729 length:1812 start_codon:yes stop_codon:yes gene_type:complete
MKKSYIQFTKITFSGPQKSASLDFRAGVNVICGASNTGKSFLAESLDFMLGGKTLRGIPQCSTYDTISVELSIGDEHFRIERSKSGGNFKLHSTADEVVSLGQRHVKDKTDNLSGFLLSKMGLLGKMILKSKKKGTTQSFSIRDIARLVIIQETEIQKNTSPFTNESVTQITSNIAALKLLLSECDDSSVVPFADQKIGNSKQVDLLDELISEAKDELSDPNMSLATLDKQLNKLSATIAEEQQILSANQHHVNELGEQKLGLRKDRSEKQARLHEVNELLARFDLLKQHYAVDIERLHAIRESGTLFVYVERTTCPLCGTKVEDEHSNQSCAGNVESTVHAAIAEIDKIKKLNEELTETVDQLLKEETLIEEDISRLELSLNELDDKFCRATKPDFKKLHQEFTKHVEAQASIQLSSRSLQRIDELEERKSAIQTDQDEAGGAEVSADVPDNFMHELSTKIGEILSAWEFPGECVTHYDKQSKDFIIDGEPRGSRGKGLRAITHAAATIALLEYCKDRNLPHAGFVIIDSPLLAYFKPEGDEDHLLQGTNLKEKFYEYLIDKHSHETQIIIIENLHPPEGFNDRISTTVFSGNPTQGRHGLL